MVAEPTDRYRRSLRRFRFTTKGPACPASPNPEHPSACDATVVIGDVGADDPQIRWHADDFAAKLSNRAVSGDNWPHDDPRWPTTCERCGGSFTDADQWQRNDAAIYRRTDGQEFAFHGPFGRAAPPGTIVRAPWYATFAVRHPQRTEPWIVSLPDGGEWITAQEATGGGFWTVEGTPPRITVNPSIHHAAPTGWHGWIRDGELLNA